MTIDERLDRLAERHESLTQAVELMIHMQQDAWARNDAAWKEHETAWAKNEARWATTNDLITQVVQAVDGLARIANSHEQRISDLEEGRT